MTKGYTILIGDVLEQLATLPENSVHCCVTSPPYWGLRDYGVEGQIGLEATPEEFIAKMVAVFRAVRRVLREDGTLWLNIGDCYNGIGGPGKQDGGPIGPTAATAIENTRGRRSVGSKPKDLLLMPWRVALALQADGWWVRSAVCWAKKSPMPESVVDRPTSSWEPIFLMAKSARYFYDAEAVKEPLSTGDNGSKFDSDRKLTVHPNTGRNRMPPIGGVKHAGSSGGGNGNATYSGDRPVWPAKRNQRNVWHLGPEPYPEAHFATFPTEIPRRAILAGTSDKGCCAACGSPWVRKVETDRVRASGSGRSGNAPEGKNGHMQGGGETGDVRNGPVCITRTTGWEAGCGCGAGGGGGVVPCTVLDPFLGSGTTLAVARQLGRVGVGVELNPEYVKLAHDRIGKAERPHSHRTDKAEAGGLFA